MQLNQLYGILGRRKDLIQTLNVLTKDLSLYLISKVVKSVININDNISTILIHNNVETDILKKLNAYFESNFTSANVEVKSNVAIAAAVTGYARIHMIKIKVLCSELGIKILYSDTDSLITNKPLPSNLIGKNLGELKDESNKL
jgi:hypothetical protein